MSEVYKVKTFEELLKVLKEKPEWFEELKRLIKTGELQPKSASKKGVEGEHD
ncbi:MAG: hypothetical protein QXL15_00895 [Candidatus Korarchaeota archaeon]